MLFSIAGRVPVDPSVDETDDEDSLIDLPLLRFIRRRRAVSERVFISKTCVCARGGKLLAEILAQC